MKTPPLLLGAVLLFWGWQSDLLAAAAVLAAVIEGSRFVRDRWDFSDEDFSRIWTFCALLFFAAAVYAFTDSGGPESFHSLFQAPTYAAQRHAGAAAAHTAGSLMRWLPLIFFLFMAAQEYSSAGVIPAETISRMMRLRWRGPKKAARPSLLSGVNISYPYFGLCLFAASIHRGNSDPNFFRGMCLLVGWALWPHRSRRFGIGFWAGLLVVTMTLGFLGQRGIVQAQHYFETLNPYWITRLFQHGRGTDPTESRTALGEIGRIKLSGRIVIRLKATQGPAPRYLREAVYRSYGSQIWSERSSPRDDFQNVLAEKDQTTWILLPHKTNTAALNIACYVDGGRGVLPLPERCGRLENLPAYIMQTNSVGTVAVEGPGLVIFDARYGPGASIDSAPGPADLHVWPPEVPTLERVTNELHLAAGEDEGRTLWAVRRYFQNEFTYRRWQRSRPRKGETPLTQFLTQSHAGHCEYFATATVLLLRQLGIPARYAVGYAVHEKSGSGYVVRGWDAHAWCLVWDRKAHVWRDFDTTPASWIQEETGRASPLLWLDDAWSWVTFQISKVRWGQGHFREFILMGLVPILALLFIQIVRNRRRPQPGKQPWTAPVDWPGLDSEFFQIEKKLAARGLVRPVPQPLSEWLEGAVADPRLAAARGPLRELLRLHYRYRFDPAGVSPDDREALRRQSALCLTLLARTERPAAVLPGRASDKN